MMASFAAMSSERHRQNLVLLISDICGAAQSSGGPSSAASSSMNSAMSPASEALGLGALSSMLTRVDVLIRQAKVLDFHRMIALMQLALWLDW
jgi:hypothetical protein